MKNLREYLYLVIKAAAWIIIVVLSPLLFITWPLFFVGSKGFQWGPPALMLIGALGMIMISIISTGKPRYFYWIILPLCIMFLGHYLEIYY